MFATFTAPSFGAVHTRVTDPKTGRTKSTPLTMVLVLVTLLMAGDAEERLRAKLDRIAAGRGAERTWAMLVGAVYVGLGAWAISSLVSHVPADAPPLVVLACARGAILLVALAGICPLTRQPRQDRLRMLYQQHARRYGVATHSGDALA